MPLVTANMGLTEPTVGGTISPSWALILNADFGIIDQHDHTPGFGVPIPPNGLNINADLTFQGNNLLDLNSAVFDGAVVGTPAVLSIYSDGTDFYFKDINGNAIRLTESGQPASSTGNIQGLPSTPVGNAGITWANSQSTFRMLTDAGVPGANVDMGTLILRYPGSYPSPSGNYIALEAPATLATGYAIQLPDTDKWGVVPTGAVVPFFGTSAPTGWLLCDGTSYLRTTYPNLFSIIGASCGAADGTHFNVPDLRGEFLRGVSGASGNDPDAASRTAMNAGGNTGNNVGSVQSDQNKSHDHGATAFASTAHQHLTPIGSSGGTLYAQENGGVWPYGQGGVTTTIRSVAAMGGAFSGFTASPLTSGPTGSPPTASIPSDGGTESRPKNAYCNYIIKT
jgi:microcystin-dependent protein